MDSNSALIDLLKNNSIDFSEDEIEKILQNENEKAENEKDNELIECCVKALELKKSSAQQSTKKPPYLKFILFAVAAALLILVNFVLFSKMGSASSDVSAPSSENNTTAAVNSTDNVTETTTVISSDKTTSRPDVFINFFPPADGAVFYHNGKPQEITKEMMNNDILKVINDVTKTKKFVTLKLGVTEQFIEKIKAKNLCLEISFKGSHLINNLNGINEQTFNFEKVLIVLNGEFENYIFFMKDGIYQHGPIQPLGSTLSEDILACIFD